MLDHNFNAFLPLLNHLQQQHVQFSIPACAFPTRLIGLFNGNTTGHVIFAGKWVRTGLLPILKDKV